MTPSSNRPAVPLLFWSPIERQLVQLARHLDKPVANLGPFGEPRLQQPHPGGEPLHQYGQIVPVALLHLALGNLSQCTSDAILPRELVRGAETGRTLTVNLVRPTEVVVPVRVGGGVGEVGAGRSKMLVLCMDL
uniref:(northern house mosquito) hypothetical protein n=1 Tax=Culex pipiens TaxID=7175 RepID=A0A8D8CWZ9_CULPI